MKQAVSILITVLYLLGTMQVSVSFHYCGKHFKYLTVNKKEEKKSCCKGKMKADGCCTDIEVAYDIDDDQVSSAKHGLTLKQFKEQQATIHSSIIRPLIAYQLLDEVFKISHSPPLILYQRLNIIYCTFLI